MTAIVTVTQYLRPRGRPAQLTVEVPDEVGAKAEQIIAAGLRFEAEVLMIGKVSFTISDDDGDYAFEIHANGPSNAQWLIKLITEFDIEHWKEHRNDDDE
jgi:hypothetical protein